MKVLMATYWDYPHIGGLSSHMSSLCEGLEELGVEVYAKGANDIPCSYENGYSKGTVDRYKAYGENLMNLIRINNIDIINAEDVLTVLGLREAGCKKPIVLTVHGYLRNEILSTGHVIEGSSEDNFLKITEKKGYYYASFIISVDTRIKNHILKVAGRESKVTYNFVNIKKFSENSETRDNMRKKFMLGDLDKVILCPRRFTAKNGVPVLAEAFYEFVSKNPDSPVRLYLAGDGDERRWLENFFKAKNITSKVTFLGVVEPGHIPSFYNMSDLVCIPSITAKDVQEATSISCLEAMSSKVPVIASDIGGLAELITHEYNGYLVAEKKPTELAKMIEVVLHKDNTDIIHRAYDTILERHSHTAVAKEFLKIYKLLASDSQYIT
ncbi:MAG: glycosyltransferase family 4 protein [Clostridia bacterium]|nr:glycosyltransferase family 4 protein [Clostridia bacterium]